MLNLDCSFERFDQKMDDESRIDVINQKEHIIYTSANVGFGEARYETDSYFMSIKNFNPSRNIENKGWAFIQGSPIGVWCFFDEVGTLVKKENMDEGYAFTPEDIIKYCKKNNIELSKGYHERDGYQTSVYKNELNGKKVWLLSYIISLNKQDKEIKLTLDGQTGKVIKREEFPYDSY
ncbi:hypothetical protein VUJ46_13790 [Chryseobacterium sp. MYb264]|uniref:hypothetical protein n=1 Tax=Chryseobacterium sp. MYb264 TaxID=2745153 RepID=UPI002E11272C|nr:hypothetical protein VUJ46_13790 [Chryseobacterium sp. MYb264]